VSLSFIVAGGYPDCRPWMTIRTMPSVLEEPAARKLDELRDERRPDLVIG
jgi:hypothetical protein